MFQCVNDITSEMITGIDVNARNPRKFGARKPYAANASRLRADVPFPAVCLSSGPLHHESTERENTKREIRSLFGFPFVFS